MGPLYYVMAIMGCADGAEQCAEARVETVRYPTIMACQQAMPRALARNGDIDFPTITATCREAGVRMADRRANQTTQRTRS